MVLVQLLIFGLVKKVESCFGRLRAEHWEKTAKVFPPLVYEAYLNQDFKQSSKTHFRMSLKLEGLTRRTVNINLIFLAHVFPDGLFARVVTGLVRQWNFKRKSVTLLVGVDRVQMKQDVEYMLFQSGVLPLVRKVICQIFHGNSIFLELQEK